MAVMRSSKKDMWMAWEVIEDLRNGGGNAIRWGLRDLKSNRMEKMMLKVKIHA